ncbi:MAG: alpha/beta fold hydrolase [Parcubacteria group bacterium]|jgi:carboxylesterase
MKEKTKKKLRAKVFYKGSSLLLKGQGDVGVLFFHGWTSPPDELIDLGKHLNSFGYTFYAPLLTGHGTEPEDLMGVTADDWQADARRALLEIKKFSKKIFVGGISMGGDLALLISGDPEVEGIILLGTPVKFPVHNLAKAGLYFMALAKTYRKKYYPPWIKKKRGDRPAYPYYPVENAKEVVKLADAARRFLPLVNKPTLIMQAKVDHMVSHKSPEIIYSRIKSEIKEIVWLKKVYHVFVYDKGVHEKISSFVRGIQNKELYVPSEHKSGLNFRNIFFLVASLVFGLFILAMTL